MAFFRKKPVTIEAVPVSALIANAGRDWPALPGWFRDAYEAGNLLIRPDGIDVLTLEGKMSGGPGDWILRGVKGELYPCRGDIFRETYEAVEP